MYPIAAIILPMPAIHRGIEALASFKRACLPRRQAGRLYSFSIAVIAFENRCNQLSD